MYAKTKFDLYTLFAQGYLTITNNCWVEVNKRIKQDYIDGGQYYALHGKELLILPGSDGEKPSKEFIEWHNEKVCRKSSDSVKNKAGESMSANLMLDNWLLQEVTAITKDGLKNETTAKIKIDFEKDTHHWISVPHAAVQIESLLNLIVDIVTREEIIVDKEYSGAWKDKESPLMSLKEKGIIKTQSFQIDNDFLEIREAILKEICLTSSLLAEQEENEISWEKQKSTKDQFFSQMIWGTAGNFARSSLIATPYSPYPLRSDLLEQTTFSLNRPSAIKETLQFIDLERIKLYQEVHPDLSFRLSRIILPSIAVEVIEASSDINSLFSVALQVRDQYSVFRKQLKHFQDVIDNEDAKKIKKYKEIFSAINKSISSDSGKYGNSSITLGTGLLGLNAPVPKMDWVKSKFGIRATMQKLIFTKNVEATLEKLLRMFGENSPARIYEIKKYFKG